MVTVAAPHRELLEAQTVGRNDHLLLDPVLREAWAHRLVQHAEVVPGSMVLAIATAGGALSRRAAAAAGPEGRVLAFDGSTCPPEASIDAVLCEQAPPGPSDRATLVRECRSLLRPGGTIALAALTMSVVEMVDLLLGAGFVEVRASLQSLRLRCSDRDAEQETLSVLARAIRPAADAARSFSGRR